MNEENFELLKGFAKTKMDARRTAGQGGEREVGSDEREGTIAGEMRYDER